MKSALNANTLRKPREMVKTTYRQSHLWAAAVISILLLSAIPSIDAQDKLESVYSDLASSKCTTIEVDKETGSSTQRCRGIAGYKLLVLDDDARQSITVVTPGGKSHPLELWEVITPAFSSIGNKAEWRVNSARGKVSPVALIVRVNASEDPANPKRLTSYLAVVKLTGDKICVTQKISPSAQANVEARRAADTAGASPCLKDGAP